MDPVAGLGALSTGTVQTTAQSLGSLGPDAFMNLMVAQLRYQDPLAPSDANSMMQQTSMLAQTELMTKLATSQQQLLGLQRATVASDLIGTQVEGLDANEETVEGIVEAVRFTATGPLLVIDGTEVALEDAVQLGDAPSRGVTDPGAPTGAKDPAAPADGITDPVASPLTGA